MADESTAPVAAEKQPGPIQQQRASIEERIAAALNPPPEDQEAGSVEDAAPQHEAEPEDEAERTAPAEDEAEPVEAAGDEESGDEAEAPADDELEASTLADLAEALNVDIADIYKNITVPIQTPEGRVEVTIGEWKDAWQANRQTEQAQRQAAEMREGIEKQRKDMEQRLQHSIAEAAGMADQMQQALLAPFEQVPWAELRSEDPAAWAAKRQELMEAQQQAQMMRQRVHEQIENHRRELAKQHEESIKQLVQKERNALISAIPEFGNPEKAQAKTSALRKYLGGEGQLPPYAKFAPDEVETAYDHRMIVIAEKARMWDESQAATKSIKKKVVKLAKKTIKPGARQTRDEQRHDMRRGLRAKLKKSGHVDDAAALISELNRSR